MAMLNNQRVNSLVKYLRALAEQSPLNMLFPLQHWLEAMGAEATRHERLPPRQMSHTNEIHWFIWFIWLICQENNMGMKNKINRYITNHQERRVFHLCCQS
jgi:hypothetical protein